MSIDTYFKQRSSITENIIGKRFNQEIRFEKASRLGNFDIIYSLIRAGFDPEKFYKTHPRERLRYCKICEKKHSSIILKYTYHSKNLSIFILPFLYHACAKNEIFSIHWVLKDSSINSNFKKLLGFSCKNGKIGTVNYLISRNVNIHYNHEEALYYACYYNKLEIIKILISNGASIHTNRERALVAACRSGNIEIVSYLLSLGSKTHANNEGAIVNACRSGNIKLVKFLLNKGSQIHLAEKRSVTSALLSGNFDLVDYLISLGISLEKHASHYIDMACICNKSNIYNYLVRRNINIKEHSESALELAHSLKKNNHIKALVKYGADIQKYNDERLKHEVNYGDLNKALDLVKNGARYCESITSIFTLFIYSTEREKLKIAFLLKHGFDFPETAQKAFELACKYDTVEILQYLYKNYKIYVDNILRNIIKTACKENNVTVLTFIFSHFNLEWIDSHTMGRYVVSALKKYNYDIIKIFLKYKIITNDQSFKMMAKLCKRREYLIVKEIFNKSPSLIFSSLELDKLAWVCFMDEEFEMVEYFFNKGAKKLFFDETVLYNVSANNCREQTIFMLKNHVPINNIPLINIAACIYDAPFESLKEILFIYHEKHSELLQSCLEVACSYTDLLSVKKLISLGANINLHGSEAFIRCCASGNIILLEFLINLGINLKSIGSRAIVTAATFGKLRTVQALIKHGISTKEDINNACLSAAYFNQTKVLGFLINLGADISINNFEILDCVFSFYNCDIIKLILNKYLDKNNWYIKRLIKMAFDLENGYDSKIIKLIILPIIYSDVRNNHIISEKLIEPYRRDIDSYCKSKFLNNTFNNILRTNHRVNYIINLACKSKDVPLVDDLLYYFRGVSLIRQLVLIFSFDDGQSIFVEWAILCGADIHANNSGFLRWAFECNHKNYIDILLNNGANFLKMEFHS